MPSEADQDLVIRLTPPELAATVEALHDAIIRRLSWSVLEDMRDWRHLDLEIVQHILDSLASAFGKCMMDFHAARFEKDPMYQETFSLPDEAWEQLNAITLAKSWDEVPFHAEHKADCGFCDRVKRTIGR